jgi:hypothetical protein
MNREEGVRRGKRFDRIHNISRFAELHAIFGIDWVWSFIIQRQLFWLAT